MKKKIFIITLAVCLAVLSIAGSSIAYFTDTEQYTNTFTAGNVSIKLTTNGETNNVEHFKVEGEYVYPGLTLDKDVTISNTGDEAAYVAAVITLTDNDGNLLSVINADGSNNDIPVAIAKFLTDLGEDGYKMNVVAQNGQLVIYLVREVALAARTGSSVVFSDIVIPASWDNDEIDAFEDVKIEVKAYATQVVGMTNGAVQAIQTVFPEVFGGINFN